MSIADFIAVLPILVLTIAAVAATVLAAFRTGHAFNAALAACGFVLALASLAPASKAAPRAVTALFSVDAYSLFFTGLLLGAALAVTLLSYGYNAGREGGLAEFYIVLIIGTLGAIVLASSVHFASFFLGLEILGVSLYVLIAYFLGPHANEASIKYLILAGVASSFLVFGMALVYTELGTMEFSRIAMRAGAGAGPLLFAGLAMITVAAGFKLAAAPFHMWAPDVYEGAPAPVGAFLASVSKGAVAVIILRYFLQTGSFAIGPFFTVFTAIAVASMFAGNILALFQKSVKRTLAYSSVAHIGYILVAFLAGGRPGTVAAGYYLAAYFVSIIGAFGAVALLSGKEKELDSITEYRGLAWQRPWLAGAFTAMLLSLAGMPLTAGFLGKLFVAGAGVGEDLWFLVIALVVNSAISVYYYLRIIIALFSPAYGEAAAPLPGLPLAGSVALGTLTLLLVFLGVYPAPLLSLLEKAAAVF